MACHHPQGWARPPGGQLRHMSMPGPMAGSVPLFRVGGLAPGGA